MKNEGNSKNKLTKDDTLKNKKAKNNILNKNKLNDDKSKNKNIKNAKIKNDAKNDNTKINLTKNNSIKSATTKNTAIKNKITNNDIAKSAIKNDTKNIESNKIDKSNKIITYVFSILIAVILIISGVSAGFIIGNSLLIQKINYSESIERINNPDQGFYQFMSVKFSDDGIKTASNGNAQLNHLRCDISAYSDNATANPNKYGSKPLSQKSLEAFENLLKDLYSKNKNAIIRFCYDYNFAGQKDQEPSLDIMLMHVEQFCEVINKFQNTVTGIEVGMVGPWGEMHSSKVALGLEGKTTVNALIDKFLDCTTNLPILVRTPNRIYDYLGITRNDINNYEIPEDNKAYHRLGMFNDGYLGSSSDLGTFSNREKEVAFISKLNEYLPYGGEVTIPDNNPLHDIDKCLPEMFQIHLSYLNLAWNGKVIEKWKNSTYTRTCGSDKVYYGQSAFTYIENHMGYRYVLRKSIIKKDKNNINIELDIDNVGFGNLLKKKKTKVLFVQNNVVVYEKQVDDFITSGKIKYNVPIADVQNGEYQVYLKLYGDEQEGVSHYCVQFANNELWNSNLSANLIGKVKL